jgi:RND family efflux transporter MFP subunit
VVEWDSYEGRIKALERVEVRAKVSGYLIKVNFHAGQIVKKGDLLYEIDPRPYKNMLEAAKAQGKAAEAALEHAKSEYTRTKSLVAAGNAASRQELDVWAAKQSVAKADTLKAQAAVDQAQLDLDFTRITAPITGKINNNQVDEGNLVNAGGGDTLLTTIVSVDPMYVVFDVDERGLLRYRQKGQPTKGQDKAPPASLKDLKIPVEVGLEGEQGYPHKGFLDSADNEVNPKTGTIQVRGLLPNPKGILDPGMRARVRVTVYAPQKAILITERAVGTDQGRRFVYVVNDQNTVERRDVTLGRLDEGLQVISAGLKPQDWVIVNGIQRVRDGGKVDPKRVTMPGAPAESTKSVAKR